MLSAQRGNTHGSMGGAEGERGSVAFELDNEAWRGENIRKDKEWHSRQRE